MKITPKLTSNYSPSSNADWRAVLDLTLPSSHAGQRLDRALSQLLPQFSRSRIAHWIREKLVVIEGQPVLPKARVRGGEKVRLMPVPDRMADTAAPEPMALDIVHEDDALLVINKPAGLVVHPGNGNWSGTLLNALLAHSAHLATLSRAGIVHRLDKETSGLLVVAKTLEAQTALVRQLQAHSVKREYLALAHGSLAPAGTVEAPIGRHPKQRTRMAVSQRGKAAITYYETLRSYAGVTLLRCRLKTGRTHQIRVHLQSIGHPLVGDPSYGRRSSDPLLAGFPRQALHAQRLEIIHPANGKPVAWTAPLPPDFRTLIAALDARE